MLNIRQQQFDNFELANSPYFEERMLLHLRTDFPLHCQFVDEDILKNSIHYGKERARKYGLTEQSSVSFFIDLMFLLGKGFDIDFQLPWAANSLQNMNTNDQLLKAKNLHKYAIEYLDQVSGVNNEYIDKTLNRLVEQAININTGSIQKFEVYIMPELEYIWPEKYAYLGDENLKKLMWHGIKIARSYGIRSESGSWLCICFAYVLGSYFDKDPLFSWMTRILQYDVQSPEKRIEKLYSEVINYLKKWHKLKNVTNKSTTI